MISERYAPDSSADIFGLASKRRIACDRYIMTAVKAQLASFYRSSSRFVSRGSACSPSNHACMRVHEREPCVHDLP